ncbi:MutS-related protein [Chitinophaga nivalis]|uniref:DNA mismatch repair proteins mutS family domain-containing protein n=1 Tax=Chitinophaga nivalis TaxID=2991709 RepID=A0ABT3IEM7_9BACT|nr:hypothetical protein [Chitinophaga nivalis]MCW3467897.1 hypothetical protein [Chitinophaga nivalis]MCW3482412.1 hypothetical protein [Chitinophaga nivalis]
MQVTDLEIEQLLVPLLDVTGNSYARQELVNLLRQLPENEVAVYDRQKILQTLIHHGYVHTLLQYARRDFEEVYYFLLHQQHELADYEVNKTLAALQLLWRRRNRHALSGRLIQLTFLMESLQLYFDQIDARVFPAVFGEELARLQVFLRRFRGPALAVRIRSNKFDIGDEVYLLHQLQQMDTPAISAHWDIFFRYEAWLSLARSVEKYHFCFPVFREGGLALTDFYHPLLKNPVKNNLHTTGSVMLLTGPNMSGKSTLLKALGICVYLAHVGMGVPAASCVLPFYDQITITIQLSDDIKNGHSHFMMEVKHLKEVLQAAHAGKRCFAIFDELFRGTNATDAIDISRQTITGLAGFPGSFFVISTHLHELQPFTGDTSAYYIDCVLNGQVPEFRYKLREGWSDLKIGRIIFEQEGLPALLGKK